MQFTKLAMWATFVVVFVVSVGAVRADKVYWAHGGSSGGVERANLDGTSPQNLFLTTTVEARDIVIDYVNQKIYYTLASNPGADNKVRRANLDGTNQEDVHLAGSGVVTHITVDSINDKVYWTRAADLWSANLDGTAASIIHTTPGSFRGVTVDEANAKLYWLISQGADTKILSAELNGTNVQTPITVVSEFPFGGPALGGGKVYWSNLSNVLRRANVDGTNVELLTTLASPIYDLTVNDAEGKLYWSLLSSPTKLQKANLNGSGAQDLAVETAGSPITAVALDVSRPMPIPAVSEWGMLALGLTVLCAGTIFGIRHRLRVQTVG